VHADNNFTGLWPNTAGRSVRSKENPQRPTVISRGVILRHGLRRGNKTGTVARERTARRSRVEGQFTVRRLVDDMALLLKTMDGAWTVVVK
jgi:hypothetical protein